MPEIPGHIEAALGALKFSGAQPEVLRRVTDNEWKDLLSRPNFVRLTIPLRQVCGEYMPPWVRAQMDRNIADNAQRFECAKTVYGELANALQGRADFLVLKGFAQYPGYTDHPHLRMQSDIDLYCLPESVGRAKDSLVALGYEPSRRLDHITADHLPAMVRKTSWEWRGNFYDLQMPFSCELHYCFWDASTAHFAPKGLDQFWHRRIERELDEIRFPALSSVDNLGYSALNILRDVFYGAPSAQAVYELARFLDQNAGNDAFWQTWREWHDSSLRNLEAISFRLASQWFAPRLSEEAQQEIHCLSPAVQRWFQEYGRSQLATWFRENKDGVWLHVSLLESLWDKQTVLRKRLLPARVPHMERTDPASLQKENLSPCDRYLRRPTRYGRHLVSRVGAHLRILPSTLWHGVRLWRPASAFNKQFRMLIAASVLFNFGMFIFFFLYNLYLLDRGFREDTIGLLTSALAIGSIAGTIPAGVLGQRLGLRKTLVFCMAFVSLLSALRTLPLVEMPLLLLAFLAGAVSTIWAVSISPAIAQLTTEEDRPIGFSIFSSSGIAAGILGGQVGGRLPEWLEHAGRLTTPARAKQEALLIACGIVALAACLVSRVQFTSAPAREKKIYSLNPFLWRFLPAIAMWTLAVGAFSPFYNVYFSQYLRIPLRQIGSVYSVSHLSQVIGVLAAPVIFRKFGLVAGVVYMQVATAIALGCLAAATGAATAVPLYVGYVAFQWMSEPGILSLLMNQVAPSERTGASALNFLVINASNAVAGAVAGASFLRFGYPAVMTATAGMALVAAFAFRMLLGGDSLPVSQRSPTSLGL